MARVERLSAVAVRTLGVGRHADGDGLYLLVKGPEAAYWLLRYVHDCESAPKWAPTSAHSRTR